METWHRSSPGPSLFPGHRPNHSPESKKTTAQSLVAPWFQGSKMTCSKDVQNLLLNSRRATICHTHLHKFMVSKEADHIDLFSLTCDSGLLLQLKESGLSMSSIKVHLFTITAFHHKCFLKDLNNIYPSIGSQFSSLGNHQTPLRAIRYMFSPSPFNEGGLPCRHYFYKADSNTWGPHG